MFTRAVREMPLFHGQSLPVRTLPDRRQPVGSVRAEDLGLSKVHISPHVSFWGGAGLVKLTAPELDSAPSGLPDRSKRGKVCGFSKKSQQRFRRAMAKVPDLEVMRSRLITLTYPAEFPAAEESEFYKKHLDTFAKSLRRLGGSAFWVLEFQKRGAPHYHLVAFGLTGIPIKKLQAWVAQRWFEIVGSGDEKHLKAGTAVEYPRSAGKARSYIAKYCSKGDQALEGVHTGRQWGTINRAGIPFADEWCVALTSAQAKKTSRIFRRAIAKRVYESAWARLHKRSSKHSALIGKLSLEEFRQACQFMRKNANRPSTYFTVREMIFTPIALFIPISLACGGSPRFPRKWRSRRNGTAHLFAQVDSFIPALMRDPDLAEAFENPMLAQDFHDPNTVPGGTMRPADRGGIECESSIPPETGDDIPY